MPVFVRTVGTSLITAIPFSLLVPARTHQFERGRRDLEEPFQEDDNSSPDLTYLQRRDLPELRYQIKRHCPKAVQFPRTEVNEPRGKGGKSHGSKEPSPAPSDSHPPLPQSAVGLPHGGLQSSLPSPLATPFQPGHTRFGEDSFDLLFERGRRDLEEPFQEDDNSSPDLTYLQRRGGLHSSLPSPLATPFQPGHTRFGVRDLEEPFQEDDNSSPDLTYLQRRGFI
ncbi:unnamed protein product [Darwinula stevensoni]|uniref:Uncharacterized protein n=1 Tax=Darwinula stevensoni TaxID=69355 RepID=A0A7R8X8S3_9CRUS|nr:unnamed protein product [Darwinula stevensoni]CAG0890442.1 unnamed protein product [Darwinula stevensoni]